jgi:type IV pilus assembly protein PilN
MRIRLNLASRPYSDLGPALKRLRIAMGALALLCGLLVLGLYAFHERAVTARAREHALDGRIAAIERERQGYQAMMSQPDNALLLKQAATLNTLFDEKAFSWTLAMEDLETVLPGGVQVTTLEPQRAKDGHITLRLRVAGPRDRAVELVRNLEHSRRFLMPRIVGEAAEAATAANGQQLEPVSASNRFSFDLLADYNPTTAGEHRAEKKMEAKPSAAAAPAAATPVRAQAPVVARPTVQPHASQPNVPRLNPGVPMRPRGGRMPMMGPGGQRPMPGPPPMQPGGPQ